MSFLLWVIVGVMTAVVLGLLVRPLLRASAGGPTREAYDMQVYRDQLHELDVDLERGLITPQQQAAARTEIERRMLSIADAAN
ncbi:MAG: c-type cytochrome biogenesis protein CcmI, partial [Rhodospirillaceae bacterium]|nr:c-type cytochrome biogenesis protein CcmI [Rhodospirillaceae bacterium]